MDGVSPPITLLTAKPESCWHDSFNARVVLLHDEPLPALPLPDSVILDTDGLSTLHLARLLHHLRDTSFAALIDPSACGRHLLATLAPDLFAVISSPLAPMALPIILRLIEESKVARPLLVRHHSTAAPAPRPRPAAHPGCDGAGIDNGQSCPRHRFHQARTPPQAGSGSRRARPPAWCGEPICAP